MIAYYLSVWGSLRLVPIIHPTLSRLAMIAKTFVRSASEWEVIEHWK